MGIKDTIEDLRIDGVTESFIGRLALFIEGIEVTQAVQFYEADDHLTDPADRQANNALRLVANKPAWVRVYVRSIFGGSGITATLELRRRAAGFLFVPVTTLTPHGSSATSAPSLFGSDYATIRGSINNTVNFVIPADQMIGTLRFVVRVTMGSRTVERTLDASVTLRQTLRLAGVMIGYNGPASTAPNAPNLTLAAPTVTDLQNMSGTALALFPVQSTAQFRAAGNLTQTAPLQTATFPASGCGAPWDALHARVANVRTADGNQPGWIYYGLLPSGTPMGPVGGCGGGGVAVGPINQPATLAHEAGHAAGLQHAPSGGAPNPDPNFPAYEPYDPPNTPQGHDGEYGLDVNTGTVMSPAVFQDIMGYASPKWISPYHYGRLTNNASFTPTTVGMDHPWWKDLVWEELQIPRIPIPDPPPFERELELPVFPPTKRERVVSVVIRVEENVLREDEVAVVRTAAHPELPAAGATPYTVRLRDAEGTVIAEGAVVRLTTSASGCGGCAGASGRPPLRYVGQAFLPDVGPGAVLEIVQRGEAVWRREAPAEPPRIQLAEPRIDRRGGMTLRWESDASSFWLRWSPDGETWSAIETELTEPGLKLEAGRIPSGEGFLQVVAHDGFHSTESEPVRIAVPEQDPTLAILHPRDGYTYAAGEELRLWASATGGSGAEKLVWSVDGTDVADGSEAWVAFEPGEHTVAVSSGRARSEVTIAVAKPEA
ncbi:M66 family metalloprotease [Microbacterium sp.]|uniref:M66 family metalloprotease n=1 Tax=Microbacterium sp. TaxID=51671 RepID=UPI0039E6DC95